MLIQAQSIKGDYLTFNEDRHSYTLNGEIVPSVTTVNKAAYPEPFQLSAWKVKQGSLATIDLLKQIPLPVVKLPDDFLVEVVQTAPSYSKKLAQEAADIGSIVHDYSEAFEQKNEKRLIELYATIVIHPDSDKIRSCVDKFKEWKDTNKDEIIGHENIIGSARYKYAGKYDRLAKRGKHIVLSDFKTSSGIYVEQFIQLAAYKIMLKEWSNIDVDMIEILRFGKEKGEFEVHSIKKVTEIVTLEQQFLRNRETYNFIKEFKL
jgi:hypothetical protein